MTLSLLLPAFGESAKVLHIIDDDTIVAGLAGAKENIRLMGINMPERRMNDNAQCDAARTKR